MDYVVTVDPDGVGRIIYNIKALIMKTTLGLFAHLVVFACPMQSPLSKTICWISPFQRSCLRAFRMVTAPFPSLDRTPFLASSHLIVLIPSLSLSSLPTPSPHISFLLIHFPSFPGFFSLLLLSFDLLRFCLLLWIGVHPLDLAGFQTWDLWMNFWVRASKVRRDSPLGLSPYSVHNR
ncbi:hypothetical protein F5H01DRAFT_343052 [Linnemannia elongata]|nr:hypothetical protein F5H01DRAFT_343052 [Linnemannia elongata]